MPSLVTIPLSAKFFANLHPAALTAGHVVLDNLFVNDLGGLSALPRLRPFAQLPGGKVYVYHYKNHGSLIAVTSNGRVFEISKTGTEVDLTDVPVATLTRPTFAETEDALVIASGGRLISIESGQTEILTEAINATHVAFIDGYLVANDYPSARWRHSEQGFYDQWPELNVFTAEAKPDQINGLIVTRYNELVVTGPDSVEMYRTAPSGESPFYRIDTIGRGVAAPGTLVDVDNTIWALNIDREFTQLNRGSGTVVSEDVGRIFDMLEHPESAWAAQLNVSGQRFVVLQAPDDNLPWLEYEGLTFVYDYRFGRWFTLSGYDLATDRVIRWPGNSIAHVGGRVFIGGDGGAVYELDQRGAWSDAGGVGMHQRMTFQTAPFRAHQIARGAAEVEISDVWLSVRRETGNRQDAKIRLRANLDDRGWGDWSTRELEGTIRDPAVRFGAQGQGSTLQFEVQVIGDFPVEIVSMTAEIERLM